MYQLKDGNRRSFSVYRIRLKKKKAPNPRKFAGPPAIKRVARAFLMGNPCHVNPQWRVWRRILYLRTRRKQLSFQRILFLYSIYDCFVNYEIVYANIKKSYAEFMLKFALDRIDNKYFYDSLHVRSAIRRGK